MLSIRMGDKLDFDGLCLILPVHVTDTRAHVLCNLFNDLCCQFSTLFSFSLTHINASNMSVTPYL